jgi:phage terminase large subunit-like protein
MMPTLAECDQYFYDAEAAERPIRFSAKYLRHYEGRFAGQPFTFLGWQSDITRALFGWKRRADGLRRFRELYLLTAKGSGKTPWLSAIGMYLLLADGEAGAHVMSCATDFPQAFLTLDAAKKYIAAEPALQKQCRSMQFEVRSPRTNSKWTVLSGTAEGRHGFRPSALLMDEAHEWPNGKLYANLTANLTKRQQPLCLVATNAGENEHCFCWQLHRRAMKAMDGSGDETLLPVIYEAGTELDWDSEAAAKAANPSLGDVIRFEQLKPELNKAAKAMSRRPGTGGCT